MHMCWPPRPEDEKSAGRLCQQDMGNISSFKKKALRKSNTGKCYDILMFFYRGKSGGRSKGPQRQRLIGSAVAGFNHAKRITKASATDLHALQDDYNKGI